jgi:NADPH2:quinone reductase
MKAAYINATGPADSTIQFGDLPKPEPTGSQVLIKVGAVALNPIDTYLRNGANYWELPKPFIIGCDVAGTIEAVGSHVKRFKVGDRVWGSNQGLMGRQGTFAEFCAADEQWLYPTPHTVTDEEAAACALVGITAHLGLFREAKLEVGEMIFVNGGSGGVGSMVVQMAKIAGARVIATAGSAVKVAALKKLGADVAVTTKLTTSPRL